LGGGGHSSKPPLICTRAGRTTETAVAHTRVETTTAFARSELASNNMRALIDK